MSVPLFDLNLQHQALASELRSVFDNVLAHGKFILGPEVEALEKEVANVCRSSYAIGCANGSDALLLALMAFDIGPGDEVITTPYSFFATASAIARVGARAVFADISLSDYNLDPIRALNAITPRTKAILPVHLYGQSAALDAYLKISKERGIHLIEDAAQAIGAKFQNTPVGAIGDIGCFSFFPTKNLGGLGDGGMLLTHHSDLAEKLRVLRVHGMKPKYHHPLLGVNSRLDTLQAAFLRVKLPHLSRWAEARARNAAFYTRHLVAAGLAEDPIQASPVGERPIILPAVLQSNHVYNQFVIRMADPSKRDALRAHLQARGVGTEIYYPIPLHLQECFASWGYKSGDFPNAELAAVSTVALPIFPELTESELLHVVKALKDFHWKI